MINLAFIKQYLLHKFNKQNSSHLKGFLLLDKNKYNVQSVFITRSLFICKIWQRKGSFKYHAYIIYN